MNRITSPPASATSLTTALRRSSNSPRYLAPGDERGEVERDDLDVLEALGHVALHDADGEALGDGGLADARLADEHGVVLGAAAEDLQHAPDLGVAPDDRVDLALPREVVQVARRSA